MRHYIVHNPCRNLVCLLLITFDLRTSKFCWGSLFLIFWLLQPQFVLNFVLISVSSTFEIMRNQNKKSRHWKTILIISILRRSLYIYPRLLTTMHFVVSHSPCPQVEEVNFFVAQWFYNIQQTFSLFFSLSLSLFLNWRSSAKMA